MAGHSSATFSKEGKRVKKFKINIYAYHYRMTLVIECVETPKNIENAIIDKLGKNDIEWEYLGEMYDPRTKRITYEEVINDADTSTRSIQTEKVTGSTMGAGAS